MDTNKYCTGGGGDDGHIPTTYDDTAGTSMTSKKSRSIDPDAMQKGLPLASGCLYTVQARIC